MPCALAQQPLSYIPTARPLDLVGVTHDDQPIGRPGQPDVETLPEALATSVLVQTEHDGMALHALEAQDMPVEDISVRPEVLPVRGEPRGRPYRAAASRWVPVVRSSSPVVRPRPSTGNRTGCHKRDRVQALVDVAATYLETLPGEPADDHTVVMVHVNAEALGVPAGTSVEPGTCHVEGHGPIEPATAERLLCTPNVQGVLVGRGGKVLILGRTKRFATRP